MRLGSRLPITLARPILGVGKLAMRVWAAQNETNLGLLSAGVAFYGLLSLFPGITAAVAIAGLVTDPSFLVAATEAVNQMLPPAAAEILLGQLEAVVTASDRSLGWAAMLAIGLALYSASKAVANLVIGLNVINKDSESRSFIVQKALNIGLTLGLITGLLVAVAVVAALPTAAALLSQTEWLPQTVLFLRWPVLFFLGVYGISLLFRFGPSHPPPRWRSISPGAVLACALWVAGSYGFSLYVQSFGNYNETFGALGGVIALLTWLWLSAYIVFLGATVDAELGHQDDDQTEPPAPSALSPGNASPDE